MRILISGAGIAGPTLAYWLIHYGFEVTIVEKSPQLRTGGYIVDFWGAGFDVADRMGLMPEIRSEGYLVEEVRVVNRENRRVAGFPAQAFAKVTGGRFLSIARTALSSMIFEKVKDKAEALFGDSVERLQQSEHGVKVEFESGQERVFDLVIGADGLHSRVRELSFGPEQKFERYLGCKVAGFQVEGYRPRDELVYVMYTEVGQQISRFALRGDETMFLFTFLDESADFPGSLPEQKAVLRQRFDGRAWEVPQILNALDQADHVYFDRISQIRMPAEQGPWTRDRVALVGDAAFCVSLLAGQGTALAMVASYILAGELHRANGNYKVAFEAYQKLLGPFILKKQNAAIFFAGAFAPKSRFSMFLRNQVMNLFSVEWIAEWAFGRDLADRIDLPDY